MTHNDATKLLDHVRDGVQYPAPVVNEALAMTGDQQHASDLPCPEISEFVQALRQSGAL